MSYQSEIYSAITGDATLSALIGTRFSWGIADGTKAAPYIVAQKISSFGETPHDASRNLEFPLVQFSCWAKTPASAIATVSALNALLDGKTITGSANASFTYSNQLSSYDDETKLHGEIIEYRVSTNIN